MSWHDVIEQIRILRERLVPYHWALRFSHVSDHIQKLVGELLGNNCQELTITSIRNQLQDLLSAESVLLQFGGFQKALDDGSITLWSQRLDENKRLELYRDYKFYELCQIAFSLPMHYFQLNFKKGDKEYNKKLFEKAIDAMVIVPSKVPLSSLRSLGIKVLDPDCQNFKEVLKQMYSLSYQGEKGTVYTPTINVYQGKFVTFSSQYVVYPTGDHPTAGEKRKRDVRTRMAVYQDLFSAIRREHHILEALDTKKDEYQTIKNELLSMIKAIEWNKKCYGASVVGKVQEIIKEISTATSAHIVAQKVYHLYKIYGKHSEHDKKHLQAAITKFTKRIAEMIGIASHVQLHALELEDQLEDQQNDLKLFHAQVKANADISAYGQLVFMFETYYTYRQKRLKEPFLSFDRQIADIFGTVDQIQRQDPARFIKKADLVISMQKIFLDMYVLEHKYKEGEMSFFDVLDYIADNTNADIQSKYPWLYDLYFAAIHERQKCWYSLEAGYTYDEITDFFAPFKDMSRLSKQLNDLVSSLS